MNARDINERLDRISLELTSAEALNTLHACRPGHPLGRGNDWRWRNLSFLVALRRDQVRSVDRIWLSQMAEAEEFANEPHHQLPE